MLHQFGLYSRGDFSLSNPPRMICLPPWGQPRQPRIDPGFLGRDDLPSIVFLALSIPRRKLEVFTSNHQPGTPAIYVRVANTSYGFHNHFYAIQCFFGTLITDPKDDAVCDVCSDDNGWQGSSDMIVTCAVPTWSLLLGPRTSLRVALSVLTSPATSDYTKKLGIDMTVFECGLDDTNLRILARPPGVRCAAPMAYLGPEEPKSSSISQCSVSLGHNSCATMLRMTEFSSAGFSKARIVQVSPCTLVVELGSSKKLHLQYPYPIDGKRQKTNIAADIIEVIVPIASALSQGGYDYNPFPIYLRGHEPISLLIPSLDLNKQAVIPTNADLNWIPQFMSWSLSGKERELYDRKGAGSTSLLQLKSSMNAMLQNFAGTHKDFGQIHIFKLTCDHIAHSCDTFLFGSALRHHNIHGSILLDAYVLPLSVRRTYELRIEIERLIRLDKVLTIGIESREEEVLWKQLLPVQVECCRQTWHHREDCQYRTQHRIPLSTDHGHVSICSCGEGQDIKGFPLVNGWETLAKYSTRVAIMPLSAVPYIESFVTEGLKKEMSKIDTELTSMDNKQCAQCGKISAQLKKCARCRDVAYCNHACQKAAWKGHKKHCRTG